MPMPAIQLPPSRRASTAAMSAGPPRRSGEANVLMQVTTIVPRNPAKQALPNLVNIQPSPGSRWGRPRVTALGLGHSIGHAPGPKSRVKKGYLIDSQRVDMASAAHGARDGGWSNAGRAESVWPPVAFDAGGPPR